VNGGLTDWRGDVAADDPGAYAADEFARLLNERGVAVGSARGRAAPPGGTQGASVQSATVSEIVAEMLSASDNLTAEVLTREIGLTASGAGTTAAGVAEIRRVLATLNVPTGGLVLNDGSGLSRDDRISCATLNAALNRTTLPEFASIRESLAVAGTRGTLIGRYVGTPVQGHLVAKTGSLDGASALAGFLDVRTPLQFALIANGNFSEAAANGVRERVVDVLARYPDVPPLERLVPSPERR
jgi:D-alanyl-D-alanine carboxypeptidase/D-alanyl-D-alanine-endopeptidase (penicillin-binding protein 4)